MCEKPYKHSISDRHIHMELDRCHKELSHIQETLDRNGKAGKLLEEEPYYIERNKELFCEMQSLEDLLKKK